MVELFLEGYTWRKINSFLRLCTLALSIYTMELFEVHSKFCRMLLFLLSNLLSKNWFEYQEQYKTVRKSENFEGLFIFVFSRFFFEWDREKQFEYF
jgi:hypothetical protein